MAETLTQLLKLDALNNLIKLNQNEKLVDILIDIERLMDNFNVYVYENWIKGELIGGPYLRRHWVKMMLKYRASECPDPRGALILQKHGFKVKVGFDFEQVPIKVKSPEDYQPGTHKPKMERIKIIIIELSVPRHYLDDQREEEIQKMITDYEEESAELETTNTEDGDVDSEDVADAETSDLEGESTKEEPGSQQPGMENEPKQ